MRRLALAFAALAAGCASHPDAEGPRAHIAQDVLLTLPTPPGYPETRTIVQTGRAHYGVQDVAFEAVVQLDPQRTEIVLTMLGGPRLATITWDSEGVNEERAPFVPPGLPVENILSDIFVTTWPAEAVSAALPEGVTLTVAENGARTIQRGDTVIMTAVPDPENAARVLVRNEAFGYQVAIVSQSVDQ